MIILTTGKGGVGKTTLSAATGLGLARHGYRTVVVSVDPAHSLGDVLDVALGNDPIPVAPGLDAAEVRLSAAIDEHWGTIQAYLSRLLQSQGVESWLAEDVAYLPGLEEIAGLLKLRELAAAYDRVVVDCPPTGSTLRYLNLPEAIQWYMEKFFPLERRIVQAVGPVAERLVGVPMPGGAVLDEVEQLFEDVLALRRLLTDPAQAVAQVATTAESVVCRETERAVGYLHLHDLNVSRVLLNRAGDGAVAEAAARFAPLDVVPVAVQGAEPVGLARLKALAESVFGAADPTPGSGPRRPLSTELDGEAAVVWLRVPRPEGSGGDDLKVGRRGDDLIVDFGPVRRHLPLPPAVARRRLVHAGWTRDGIRMEFGAA